MVSTVHVNSLPQVSKGAECLSMYQSKEGKSADAILLIIQQFLNIKQCFICCPVFRAASSKVPGL